MIYTPELIKSTAPSIFATSPSSKMTNKYEFVPTDKIMEFFDREGWEISSVKQNGTGIHALHEVKFRMDNFHRLAILWLKQSSKTLTMVCRHSQ